MIPHVRSFFVCPFCYRLSVKPCPLMIDHDRLLYIYFTADFSYTIFAKDIENLTQKTGNYKQFDVFVAMLQSGLLKTSECITLDLLTFEDLELLRARRTEGGSLSNILTSSNNRRYLILTYTVEFDR